MEAKEGGGRGVEVEQEVAACESGESGRKNACRDADSRECVQIRLADTSARKAIFYVLFAIVVCPSAQCCTACMSRRARTVSAI